VKLRMRCPVCKSLLECFHTARDEYPDYKRGEFVVVCYNCRTPEGGLQRCVEFKCAKCGEEFDPRILEYSHGVGNHLCPNCYASKHRRERGVKENCPICHRQFDSAVFDFSHEVNARICGNCDAKIHRVKQWATPLVRRYEDCPYCLEERGEMVKGLLTGEESHYERLVKSEYECPACGRKYWV